MLFEGVVGDGYRGDIAIDNIFLLKADNCLVYPPSAQVKGAWFSSKPWNSFMIQFRLERPEKADKRQNDMSYINCFLNTVSW